MSKIKLIVREGYGSEYRPYLEDAKIIDPKIEVPDTHDILGIIRYHFDVEADGSRRSNDELTPAVRYERINNLVGKLLTLLDASFSDAEQRKAMKDLVMKICWDWWSAQSDELTEPWREDKFPKYKARFEN